MTVLQLRAKLSEIDLDKNKRMCISEYLLFKFDKSPKDLVNAPQGDAEVFFSPSSFSPFIYLFPPPPSPFLTFFLFRNWVRLKPWLMTPLRPWMT